MSGSRNPLARTITNQTRWRLIRRRVCTAAEAAASVCQRTVARNDTEDRHTRPLTASDRRPAAAAAAAAAACPASIHDAVPFIDTGTTRVRVHFFPDDKKAKSTAKPVQVIHFCALRCNCCIFSFQYYTFTL